MTPNGVEQNFAFDTFGGAVNVSQEACAPNEPPVTVVRGTTQMTLPMIGENGNKEAAMVSASFKLCQSTLRSVSFEFYSSIGIPVGNTGLFATGMSGGVDIFPDNTQIHFGMDLQVGQGNTPIWQGTGQVMIDTRLLRAV